MPVRPRRLPISIAFCACLALPAVAGAQRTYITAHFQTTSGHYVVAEGGGGGAINANRCCPGPWETFTIIDENGGTLEHSDTIYIHTSGFYFWAALQGGGSTLDARFQAYPGFQGTFYIQKLSGSGPIVSGDQIAFRTFHGYFVVAEGGGGGVMNANRVAIGPWETFTITMP